MTDTEAQQSYEGSSQPLSVSLLAEIVASAIKKINEAKCLQKA